MIKTGLPQQNGKYKNISGTKSIQILYALQTYLFPVTSFWKKKKEKKEELWKKEKKVKLRDKITEFHFGDLCIKEEVWSSVTQTMTKAFVLITIFLFLT